ncbi:helix-turn-helix domain-containing protein [uncultured Clostridium sp.]|uniref:helix-turn-helix domain-containing protein n=1 Tax=uncultured Clostridium sp. TaxID=59620 RepID=UPI0028E31731|nr:helix-turn-helix domain-containing protein [uncultured Clostridium sp.]
MKGLILEKEKKMIYENHNTDEIMTISEVAEYLKISEVTTYKLVQEGKMPAFKIGRHWRIKKNDLTEFIEALKRGENI